jgi:hypothetical protein
MGFANAHKNLSKRIFAATTRRMGPIEIRHPSHFRTWPFSLRATSSATLVDDHRQGCLGATVTWRVLKRGVPFSGNHPTPS